MSIATSSRQGGGGGGGYVKASGKSEKKRHAKLAGVEKKGVALKWRAPAGSAAELKKQTKTLLHNIKAAHLYPAAKVASVSADDDGVRIIVFDAKCSSPLVGQIAHWVVIANGDGNEAAQVFRRFACAAHGRSAVVPDDCKLSSGKLKGAVIYFGPQPVDAAVHESLLANVAKFPKSKRAVQLVPTTFARLQSACT